MDSKVYVFMDFDDVINWHGTSRNQLKKYGDMPGYWRKADIPLKDRTVGGWGSGWSSYQRWVTVEWSSELVRKLMDLKDETGYVWRWLTTWVDETTKLDSALSIKSDGYVDWDAYPSPPVSDISAYRCARKLEVVLDFIKNNPDTPFVWVDDEATKLWTPELDAKVTAPHLIVTPVAKYGIVRHELNKISDFIRKHSL